MYFTPPLSWYMCVDYRIKGGGGGDVLGVSGRQPDHVSRRESSVRVAGVRYSRTQVGGGSKDMGGQEES